MRRNDISEITGQKRFQSPVVTPQALAWDGKQLWVSSRDLGTLYKIDSDMWKVVEEVDAPGCGWAGVSLGDSDIGFTSGPGSYDDPCSDGSPPQQSFTK